MTAKRHNFKVIPLSVETMIHLSLWDDQTEDALVALFRGKQDKYDRINGDEDRSSNQKDRQTRESFAFGNKESWKISDQPDK